MKKIINVVISLLAILLLAIPANATEPIYFSYDIGIPKEFVLVPYEHLYMPGRVINTGSVPIGLTNEWGAIWGIPGPVSEYHWGPTNNDGDFNAQFQGVILNPGESYDFTWFNFFIDGEWFMYEGNEYGGSFGIRLPEGATWKQAGYVDGVVEGVWKGGYVQSEINFNAATIDYSWVNWPESSPPIVPEPVSSILFITGGATLAVRNYLKGKKNV